MQYDSYKDSGEQWLGQIPSHWEMVRTKFLWQETDNRSEFGNEQLLSVSQYDGIRESKDESRSESLKGYKIVHKNELVINIMLAWLGGLGISDLEGIVSPAYCVYKLKRDVNPHFLHYLYKTSTYLAEFARHSTGIVPSRWRMYTDDFGSIWTLLPPKNEQERMVAYLDKETAAIDAAIAQQQKMIDLLNERKQIIIQQAVTKGLDPNAKMKDSGIDWIGQIPEGWEVKKLKHCFCTSESGIWGEDEKNDGEDKICVRVADFDYEKGCIKENNLTLRHYGKDFTEQKRLKHRDLLLEKSGGGDLYPVGRVVRYSLPDDHIATCSNFIQKLTPFEDVDYNFLYYVFRTMYFAKVNGLFYNQTTGIQNLKVKEYLNQNIYLPVLQEQQNIVRYLEGVASEIERHVDVCHSQISLLRERKQIIINEVVTGKIKV